jgi:hypothetical protein
MSEVLTIINLIAALISIAEWVKKLLKKFNNPTTPQLIKTNANTITSFFRYNFLSILILLYVSFSTYFYWYIFMNRKGVFVWVLCIVFPIISINNYLLKKNS